MIEDKGIGWRIAIDNSEKEFPILIGGESIAVKLTNEEWNELVAILRDITHRYKEFEPNSFTDESLVLEIEKDSWWICLEGLNDSWSLKLIFSGDKLNIRSFEMYWPIQSAATFVSSMLRMWDSYQ